MKWALRRLPFVMLGIAIGDIITGGTRLSMEPLPKHAKRKWGVSWDLGWGDREWHWGWEEDD